MRISLFLLGLLVAGGALAEPDSFGLGTGRSGPLRVDVPDTIINRYGRLTASAAAGAKELRVSNADAFLAGELVLLHQTTGLLPVPDSGVQGAIPLFGSAAGRFEYARVETVTEGTLRLTAPLRYGYAANVTQVVSVPEHTDVQVLAGASLRAAPWDGSVGGILALLATGTLTNAGLITVDRAGFRGGGFINHPGLDGCTSLDAPAGQGGSYKGEGLVAERFGKAAGRGNLANGGGGGVCHNSGGGGGGHSGMGGRGGNTIDIGNAPRQVGGLGGAPVVYLPYEHILFGGGGGGGGGHVDGESAGATGGGVMLIRAREVTGQGRFSAMGGWAAFVPSSLDDGAGGGGAGGAISVRAEGGLGCGLAQASGGAGGDTKHPTLASGPGGGGGGGVVFLQGMSITCPASVVAGFPGQSTAGGGPFGAGPDTVGGGSSYGLEQRIPLPFRVPPAPVLSQPANGATGVARRPRIEGSAQPGVVVHLFLDGVPYAQVVSGEAGAFSYTPPTDLAGGAHELRAMAEVFGSYSSSSAVHRFDVATSGEEPALVAPAEGAAVNPMPLFLGTSRAGATVSIEVDGTEVARVPLDEQRRFRYTLTAEQALAEGSHSARVRAWDEAGNAGLSSPVTRFEVKLPAALDVGCGCGSSPGVGLGAVVLLLGLRFSRFRGRQAHHGIASCEAHTGQVAVAAREGSVRYVLPQRSRESERMHSP